MRNFIINIVFSALGYLLGRIDALEQKQKQKDLIKKLKEIEESEETE
jgi:hypothetical protein